MEIKDFWEKVHKEQDLNSLTGCSVSQELGGLFLNDNIFSGAKVLVIGVGNGGCCEGLKNIFSCDVDALDISETGLKNVKDYVTNSFLPNDILPENKYDFILSNHVSQHMADEDFENQTIQVIKSLNERGVYGLQFITNKNDCLNNIYTQDKCNRILLSCGENRLTGGAVTRSFNYFVKLCLSNGAKIVKSVTPIQTRVPCLFSNVIHIMKERL